MPERRMGIGNARNWQEQSTSQRGRRSVMLNGSMERDTHEKVLMTYDVL
jgi:hypothetical protein